METAEIELVASPTYQISGGEIVFWGLLSPPFQNKTIIIYFKKGSAPWSMQTKTTTDAFGQFKYIWKTESSGTSYVRASWSGDNDYGETASPICAITILPITIVMLLTITVFAICISITIGFALKRARTKNV
jgi:hypothetical protein